MSLDDLLGGKVPAAIASQIQANSKLNYVMYAFGDLPGGVTAALSAAGLDKKVTQMGQDFSDADLPEISAGTMKAWAADPKGYAAWLMVDSAARLATGMSPADMINFRAAVCAAADLGRERRQVSRRHSRHGRRLESARHGRRVQEALARLLTAPGKKYSPIGS